MKRGIFLLVLLSCFMFLLAVAAGQAQTFITHNDNVTCTWLDQQGIDCQGEPDMSTVERQVRPDGSVRLVDTRTGAWSETSGDGTKVHCHAPKLPVPLGITLFCGPGMTQWNLALNPLLPTGPLPVVAYYPLHEAIGAYFTDRPIPGQPVKKTLVAEDEGRQVYLTAIIDDPVYDQNGNFLYVVIGLDGLAYVRK